MATIDDLTVRLSAEVPAGYIRYSLSQPDMSLAKQGFDPTTLLVLNLELAEHGVSDEEDMRFFINGDGCGNYLFVDGKDEGERVQMWVHDPLEIADLGVQLSDYLPDAEQECRIDRPPEKGRLYICRTQCYGESILNPIRLDEWTEAVAATDMIEHRGYWEATNPFTHKKDRFTEPGYSAVLTAGKERSVRWYCGRAFLDDTPANRDISRTLAEKLAANVLGISG
ncbi:MAG: hypothetical protein AAGJ46_07255 [Planctomycetota bacterium]